MFIDFRLGLRPALATLVIHDNDAFRGDWCFPSGACECRARHRCPRANRAFSTARTLFGKICQAQSASSQIMLGGGALPSEVDLRFRKREIPALPLLDFGAFCPAQTYKSYSFETGRLPRVQVRSHGDSRRRTRSLVTADQMSLCFRPAREPQRWVKAYCAYPSQTACSSCLEKVPGFLAARTGTLDQSCASLRRE